MSDSDDLPFYAPNRKLTPPKRRRLQGERLWELRRGADWMRAGIVYHIDPVGFEFQVYRNGDLLGALRCPTREGAVAFSDSVKAEYAQAGWTEGQERKR